MDSTLTEEHILVVPESFIHSIGKIDGYEPDVDRFLNPILDCKELSFQPRSKMEVDPRFKQLIPYVLLEWIDDDRHPQLFTYTRGGGGGESRLHAKRSVGIGGHISLEDVDREENPYRSGMLRELSEEVQIGCDYEEECTGLIYDPSNDVGKVHLGVVHRFRLSAPLVSSNEDDLADGGFIAVKELLQQKDRLETWSWLAIEAIYPELIAK